MPAPIGEGESARPSLHPATETTIPGTSSRSGGRGHDRHSHCRGIARGQQLSRFATAAAGSGASNQRESKRGGESETKKKKNRGKGEVEEEEERKKKRARVRGGKNERGKRGGNEEEPEEKKERDVRNVNRRVTVTPRADEAPSTGCCSRAWLGLACGGKAPALPAVILYRSMRHLS